MPDEMKRRRLYLRDLYREWIIPDGYIVAAFLIFHRDAVERLPHRRLYDETFLYGEELFWRYEWLRYGFEFGYYPEEKVTHLIGPSSSTKSDYIFKLRNAYQAWGEYLFLKRRYTKFTLTFFYAIKLVRQGTFFLQQMNAQKIPDYLELVAGSLKVKYKLKP